MALPNKPNIELSKLHILAIYTAQNKTRLSKDAS